MKDPGNSWRVTNGNLFMEPERWQQVEDIFHHAVRFGGEERGHYLAEVCAHDTWLRAEVESLINSYEEDRTFLDRPVFEEGLKALARQTTNMVAGNKFSTYTILSALGHGGMGYVYLAIDSRLGRKVAIKI